MLCPRTGVYHGAMTLSLLSGYRRHRGIKGAAFHWQACSGGGCRCPQRRDMRTMRDITTPPVTLTRCERCGLALRACLGPA
jgi:hypothetical protein